ncbi:MAG: hypothetical protein RRC07_16895, partial [Anaerolineae bacterium]|nr:hypothetical protein [Anaerolineae bacterium]
MALFATPEQLYGVAADLFGRLEEERPQAVAQLVRARLLVRLALSGPPGEIWIHGRQRPVQVRFGYQRLHPDLEAQLEADTLHQILVGHLSLIGAVSDGL